MLKNYISHILYFISDFWPYLVIVLLSSIIFIVILYFIYKSKLFLTGKRIVFSILTTIFVFILTYSFLEAYFRYVYDVSDGLGFLNVNNKWHARHVVYNNYFFRDRDFDVDKKTGAVRIGVLGDSVTAGGGIEDVNNRFSNILERKLRKSGFNAEVYNLGKSGYDTQGEIEQYQSVKHLNFDIIVWEYFLNDIQPENASTGSSIIAESSQKTKLARFFSDKSYLFDFIYWRFSSRYKNTFEALKTADLAQYKNENILTTHQKIIASFIEELKKENKKIIIVIFPFVHLIGPNYPAQSVHSEMDDFFVEQGVEVIDLLRDIKEYPVRDLVASRFDSHPNEFVHRIAADKIFEKITPLLEKSSHN